MSVVPFLDLEDITAKATQRLVDENRRLRAENADLKHRIDTVLKRAAEVDPTNIGRLGVELHHELPTILRRSTDQP